MIRTSLLGLAALSALALPMSASAASADPALAAFQSLCVANSNSYAAVISAAKAAGWTDTQLIPSTDDAVSITSKAALEKTGPVHLTLLVTQGLRHTKGGDVQEGDCKVSTDTADAAIVTNTQGWLGFAPDAGDTTLASFFVKTGAPPSHIAAGDLNAAMGSGGFSIIKAQQDQGSAILVYTTFSK
jgi:hypothetical protein